MTTFTKYLISSVFFLGSGQLLRAQPIFASGTSTNSQQCKPPKNRELFHDYIDAQQRNVLKSDGKNDNQFTPSKDDEINFLLTQSLVKNIDELQCKIERDSTIKDQVKVRYLRGVESLLKFFYCCIAYVFQKKNIDLFFWIAGCFFICHINFVLYLANITR